MNSLKQLHLVEMFSNLRQMVARVKLVYHANNFVFVLFPFQIVYIPLILVIRPINKLFLL